MSNPTHTIIGDLDYVSGHLRYGQLELKLSDSEIEDFDKLSKEEQIEWLKDEGDLIVNDYEVSDYGDVYQIRKIINV